MTTLPLHEFIKISAITEGVTLQYLPTLYKMLLPYLVKTKHLLDDPRIVAELTSGEVVSSDVLIEVYNSLAPANSTKRPKITFHINEGSITMIHTFDMRGVLPRNYYDTEFGCSKLDYRITLRADASSITQFGAFGTREKDHWVISQDIAPDHKDMEDLCDTLNHELTHFCDKLSNAGNLQAKHEAQRNRSIFSKEPRKVLPNTLSTSSTAGLGTGAYYRHPSEMRAFISSDVVAKLEGVYKTNRKRFPTIDTFIQYAFSGDMPVINNLLDKHLTGTAVAFDQDDRKYLVKSIIRQLRERAVGLGI